MKKILEDNKKDMNRSVISICLFLASQKGYTELVFSLLQEHSVLAVWLFPIIQYLNNIINVLYLGCSISKI